MLFLLNMAYENAEAASSRIEELLLLIGEGDKSALAELYDSSRASVYGFALSILKNGYDAEDVLQNAFVQIWSSAADYRPNGKPMAWILTVTKNLCYMKLREQKKTVGFEPEDFELQPSDHDTAQTAENKAFIAELLKVLNSDERQIIMLHAVSGLKFREIAALLDTSTPTVLSKYHRAIKKLQKLKEE